MAETSEERLARLDAETASQLKAEEQERADAELARLFPNLAPDFVEPPVDPRERKPRGEGAFAKFRREEAERKAADVAAEDAAQAEVAEDEQAATPGFIRSAIAPATGALSGRQAVIDQDFESGTTQRLFQNQSTDAQN